MATSLSAPPATPMRSGPAPLAEHRRAEHAALVEPRSGAAGGATPPRPRSPRRTCARSRPRTAPQQAGARLRRGQQRRDVERVHPPTEDPGGATGRLDRVLGCTPWNPPARCAASTDAGPPPLASRAVLHCANPGHTEAVRRSWIRSPRPARGTRQPTAAPLAPRPPARSVRDHHLLRARRRDGRRPNQEATSRSQEPDGAQQRTHAFPLSQ
jgi:hypothetical protein